MALLAFNSEPREVINGPSSACDYINLQKPITTVADDKFCGNFLDLGGNKDWYFTWINCCQTIYMNY